jgi:succinoglycan biosynthesis transport protein ExoP
MEEDNHLKATRMLALKEPVELAVPARPHLDYRVESVAEEKLHLLEYWHTVRKHLWLVTGLAVLVTMLAAIYLARKPDIFVAQGLVQVDLEDLNPALGATSKNNAVIVSNALNDPAYFNTQLRIVTSDGLLSRVVRTLDLEHNQDFLHPQGGQNRSTWQNLMRMVRLGGKSEVKDEAKNKFTLTGPVAPASSPIDMEEAERYVSYVKELSKDLMVEPVVEKRMGYGRDATRLMEIRYRHPNPRLAAKVVNTIADVLVLSNLEKKAEKSVSTGDFLQKRIAELQAQIRTGEERLLNYAKSNEILSLEASQNTVVERLIGLNRQLLEAENERKMAESGYQAALAPGAAVALAEENMSKQITDLKTRLADLRQQRAQLLVENTEKWPAVREISQQIAVLESEVQGVINRSTAVGLTNLETRYRQASARERSVRTAFNEQRGKTLTQNEAAVNYRIIQQEIETNKGLLNGLLQSYKENDVILAGVHNNVHVIDYATTPSKPIGPKRLQGLAVALLLSLSGGVGLALLLEYFNDTVRSTDEVEALLHLPALAAIPIAKGLRERNGRAALLLNSDARSSTAEAYRQLRTAVLLSTPGRAPKTLLVTSSMPEEGKTTTTVNLAISLAQTKASVLIIDADLRRPRLHSIFEVSNRSGLSTYLSSEMSESDLQTLVRYIPASNLSVLTSGPIPPNPAELLGSEQMRHLLFTLASDFTHIIIDSAPAASFTDAVVLSSLVDATLLVVKSGGAPRSALRRSQHLLASAGTKIIGVILNQVDARAHEYYYQSYYYYHPSDSDEEVTSYSDSELEERVVPPAPRPSPAVSAESQPTAAQPAPASTSTPLVKSKRVTKIISLSAAAVSSPPLVKSKRVTKIVSLSAAAVSSPVEPPSTIVATPSTEPVQPEPAQIDWTQQAEQGLGNNGAQLHENDVTRFEEWADEAATTRDPEAPEPSRLSNPEPSGLSNEEALGEVSGPFDDRALEVRETARVTKSVPERAATVESSVEPPATIVATPSPEPVPPERGQIYWAQQAARARDDDNQLPESGITLFEEKADEAAATRGFEATEPSRLGDEEMLAEIYAAFDDPAPDVRAAAARALNDFQADRVGSFMRALWGAAPERRRRIGAGIAASGLMREAIGDLTSSSSEKIREAFSLLFLMVKAGEYQPLMDVVADHPSDELRIAALKLISLSGQMGVLPDLRRLAQTSSASPELRAAAREATSQILAARTV